MKSIIKRYGSHIEIFIITVVPFGWLITPIVFFYRRNKERKKIDEKLENLKLKIVHHKPYFYNKDYSTKFKKQLLINWEFEKNNIGNEMYKLGEKHTTVRQSRLLRLITLQIYHFEIKL